MIRAGLIALTVFLTLQDRPPTLGKVLSDTSKAESYRFLVKGGADEINGTYQKGGMLVHAGGIEAAGKGGLQWARDGEKWTSLSYLAQKGDHGKTPERLMQFPPPHIIIKTIAAMMQKPEGDGFSGWYGDLNGSYLRSLVEAPWFDDETLKRCHTLRGSATLNVQDGKFSTVEVRLSGTYTEMKKRGYHGRPDPNQPPPRPPQRNWRLGPDGYWYEGNDRSVSGSIKIELSDFNEAEIEEEVRKKIGVRIKKKKKRK